MILNDSQNPPAATPNRVAIYARYSSDLQRPSSIEDQIRQCRDAADRNGWVVADEYIRFDSATSGRSLVGRDGLEELIKLAEQPSRPFAGIVIDDTSRIGRNLSDTLPLSDFLEHAGVFLHFANQTLNSRDPNFRLLYIAYGQHDEQYSRHLAELVHRGQRGRVLKGFVGSGRVYGYNNIPIEDPTRKGLYGRPCVEAVKMEINLAEAAVVVRIFQLYVAGLGCRAIATSLNAEGVPSPLKGQSKMRRLWTTFTISTIVSNEKYRGVHVWNRTKTIRNPRTHRREQRPRPKSEWEQVDVPAWRIVDEKLWEAAVVANQKRQGPISRKVGGLNRSEASREYIFSGVMVCADCGGSFNVIAGKGTGARYGCVAHRARGTCPNKLTILRRVLESELLHTLSESVRDEALRDYLSKEFKVQLASALKARARMAERDASSIKSLQGQQDHLRKQAENLLDAIAATNGSSLVYGRLNAIESQIKVIDVQLTSQVPFAVASPSADDLRHFLDREMGDLEALLAKNPEVAKQRVLKHVGKLTMDPVYLPQGPTYKVGGDVRLFVGHHRDNADVALARIAGSPLITKGRRIPAAA
jgi:DNA invertase Pin-like site-specific DNA recombinase